MPSKRTNDSVDRILEELSHEQAERGIRDSVTCLLYTSPSPRDCS